MSLQEDRKYSNIRQFFSVYGLKKKKKATIKKSTENIKETCCLLVCSLFTSIQGGSYFALFFRDDLSSHLYLIKIVI